MPQRSLMWRVLYNWEMGPRDCKRTEIFLSVYLWNYCPQQILMWLIWNMIWHVTETDWHTRHRHIYVSHTHRRSICLHTMSFSLNTTAETFIFWGPNVLTFIARERESQSTGGLESVVSKMLSNPGVQMKRSETRCSLSLSLSRSHTHIVLTYCICLQAFCCSDLFSHIKTTDSQSAHTHTHRRILAAFLVTFTHIQTPKCCSHNTSH